MQRSHISPPTNKWKRKQNQNIQNMNTVPTDRLQRRILINALLGFSKIEINHL